MSEDRYNCLIEVTGEAAGAPLIGIKDNIDVRGLVSCCGTRREGPVARSDAAVVERVRSRTGCGLVKTNMDEYAFGGSGLRSARGPVRNPLDPSRICGGSSSGSAVAVAAGLCPWALGTDTGGSVRIPAALCGVIGFKPSLGLLPMNGVAMSSPSLDTLGIICATMPLLRHGFALVSERPPREARTRPRRADYKLGYPAGWVQADELEEPVREVWERTAALATEVPFLDPEPLMEIHRVVSGAESWHLHSAAYAEDPGRYCAESRAFLESAAGISAAAYQWQHMLMSSLVAAANRVFDVVDALVLPTTAMTAPPTSARYADYSAGLTRFVKPFNVLGWPCVSIPVWPTGGRLPVGIQVVGKPHGEMTVLDVAEHLLDGYAAR